MPAQIVVTRPLAQAKTTLALFNAAGLKAQALPLIDIVPTANQAALSKALTHLTAMDGVIFVSPTAIEQVLPGLTWPEGLPVLVMGPGSAACAKRYNISNIYMPEISFDSEGLLALSLLQHIQGKRFMVFRGNGGRALLADTLTLRGATVQLIEAYQRIMPILQPADWTMLQQSDAVIITSSEAARNLFAQAGENRLDWLQALQYFVSHPRIGVTLQHLGARTIEVSASDKTMVADVLHFFHKGNG